MNKIMSLLTFFVFSCVDTATTPASSTTTPTVTVDSLIVYDSGKVDLTFTATVSGEFTILTDAAIALATDPDECSLVYADGAVLEAIDYEETARTVTITLVPTGTGDACTDILEAATIDTVTVPAGFFTISGVSSSELIVEDQDVTAEV